jgi:hypothetical protein
MSAREDAANPTNATRPRNTRGRVTVVLLAGALLGAVLPAAGLMGLVPERFAPDGVPRYEARVPWRGGPPAPGEWPRPGRTGEQAVLLEHGGRTLLAVRSFTVAGTESLARDLHRRRLSGVEASSARRAAARARWRAEPVPVGLESLPPAGRCAALVRARLLLVSMVDPQVAPLAPVETPGSAAAWKRLVRAEDEVLRLALAVRPDSLASALAGCASAEGEWLRAVAAEPAPDSRARIEAAWRWHERSCAPTLDRVERSLEAALSKSQNDAVVTAAFPLALSLERLAPDPCATLFAHGTWGPAPRALPILWVWSALFAAGALAGALLAFVLCLPWLWRSSRLRAVPVVHGVPEALSPYGSGGSLTRLSRDPRQAWDAELGWLHLVSGPDPARIAHAVAILAGGFAERGERVLLVDGGERLRLHERQGGDPRWGLGECLAGEVPLLGAVQATGRAGFFFLAHGAPRRAERWEELSGLLEDARGHFDRVLLALDARVPRAAALPLGGRVLEAWWAEPGPGLPRNAVALSERLGIPFSCFDLNWLMEAAREVGSVASAQTPEPPPTAAEACDSQPAGVEEAELLAPAGPDPVVQALEPVGPVWAPDETIEAPAPSGAGAVVLGCDLEVRERLRFMVWMRRVQAERQAAAFETSAGH